MVALDFTLQVGNDRILRHNKRNYEAPRNLSETLSASTSLPGISTSKHQRPGLLHSREARVCLMEDNFLAFVESARQMLLQSESEGDLEPTRANEPTNETSGPSWGWVCSRILACLQAYSSGVTPAILLSDLLKAWIERSRIENASNHKEIDGYNSPGLASYKRKKQLRTRLSNVVTIDSIHEKRFITLDAVLEVVILNIQILPGTSSYILTLGDAWSTNTIDMYLHRKFYDLIDEQRGVLKNGRELRLTGCRLRTAVVAGSSRTRLLPTEYLVVLLDEEQDEDAQLLCARFYADIHSGLLEAGAEFCFYARLDRIGEIELLPQWNHVKQRSLFLIDQNEDSIAFVLWDEQVSLAGLFSQGSMIAVERPFISQSDLHNNVRDSPIFLEYGSATRLYTVPLRHNEEQVLLGTESQGRAKMSFGDHERSPGMSSQLLLPRDSHGSVDYCNFPVQLFVADVKPKMSNIFLYGVVRSIKELDSAAAESRVVGQMIGTDLDKGFVLQRVTLEDSSGSIVIYFLFIDGQRSGSFEIGHTLFIAGLKSFTEPSGRVDCFWNERQTMSHLVNLSQLPALLTSPCLYQLLSLNELSTSHIGVQVCRVLVRDIKLGPTSADQNCNYFPESAFQGSKGESKVARSVVMVLELYDRQSGIDRVCTALCSGQPAREILQASIEDFLTWPEDRQVLDDMFCDVSA
ncbi:hypothetical protein KP509_11G016700 [Ceratopteris richardii]|uniref:Uncharacterized protein n=1 Tax=Ceratopteris richardii TaxID=49495 RepID=A0A8T2TVU9_CERRI|nr:hypothetical protein KP509_11G016700 [Ceratopteris richardii]